MSTPPPTPISKPTIMPPHGPLTTTTTTTKPSSPPITLHPTALLSSKALLKGTNPIIIAAGAVIHPFAQLDSTAGSIQIGEGVVVWEKARVGIVDMGVKMTVGRIMEARGEDNEGEGNGRQEGIADADADEKMKTVISKNTILHASTTVCATAYIGFTCILDVGSYVGKGAVVNGYCRLGPLTRVPRDGCVSEFTVVYWMGEEQMERVDVTMREHVGVREARERGHVGALVGMRRALGGGVGLR